MQIDQVDQVKRTDYYSEDIKQILEQKYHLEKWVKRGKEKQPTESRVQSDD
jgi:hypothetical protein